MATTPANFRPTIWRDTFKDYFAAQMSLLDLADRYDEFVAGAGYGETVQIPALTLPDSIDITPGSVAVEHAPTDTGNTLTINKIQGHPIPFDPLQERFNHPDYRNKIMREAARKIRNKANAVFLAQAGTTAVPGDVTQEVNTGGGAAADSDGLAARKLLDDAEAPQEDRHLICTPDLYNDLSSIIEYISVDFGPGQGQHKVEAVRGFQVHPIATSRFTSDGGVYSCLAFHRDAFAVGVSTPHLKVVDQAGQFRSFLEVAAIWGQKTAKADFAVRFLR